MRNCITNIKKKSTTETLTKLYNVIGVLVLLFSSELWTVRTKKPPPKGRSGGACVVK
jgi:hypothetical protein